MRFADYHTGSFFDEMFEAGGEPRAAARALVQLLETMTDGELLRRQQSAERALLHMGITFNVYGDSAGTERILPGLRLTLKQACRLWHLDAVHCGAAIERLVTERFLYQAPDGAYIAR